MRTLTTPEGFSALRRAFAYLADDQPALFRRLFGRGHHPSVQAESADDEEAAAPIWVSETLFNHGLIERRGRVVVGTVPVRRLGRGESARFYLQALGLPRGMEYLHEAWPETDALLAALPALAAATPSGSARRLLDLGTGSGVVAIEARLAGFVVVATDDDPACLMLADFNARLNGLADLPGGIGEGGGLAFRRGSLDEPVAGERFAIVLCNPDYGGVRDQLRVEVLGRTPALLDDGGELLCATMLEWQDGVPCEVPLGELVLAGFEVAVEPIVSANRADWFTVVAPGSVPGVPSRHRFVIRCRRPIAPARPSLRVRLPAVPREASATEIVPLSRVQRADQMAAVVSIDDVKALVELTDRLTAPELVLDGPLPRSLLDACRFGAQPCTGPRGAAGAIVHGISLRPCAHGEAVGRATMSLAELRSRYEALDRELQIRRGCPSCPAYTVCSRCLFPTPLPEAAYCEVSRGLARTIGLVHRLWETRQFLDDEGVPEGPLRLLRGPLPDEPAGEERSAFGDLAERWRRRYAWAIERGGRGYLQLVRDGRLAYHPLSALELDVVATLAQGAGLPGLAAVSHRHGNQPGQVATATTRLLHRLG